MPRAYMMTWEPGPRRWKKVYKGKTYTVSCRELKTPETKEASYKRANEWWVAKRAQIDDPPRPSHPHQEVLDKFDDRLRWAKEQGLPELEHRLDTVQDFVWQLPHVSPREIEELVDANLGEMAAFRGWDRQPGLTAKSVPSQIDAYLVLERARCDSKLISLSEFDTIQRCLGDFKGWVGDRPTGCLDAELIEGYWSYLLGMKISVDYKKKKLRFAKTFVNWLAEKGQIPVPPNLHSRRHRFGGTLRAVPTIPVADVKKLIDAAQGQHKLHLLLMTNCGMTQQDISDLRPSEIDWDRGRIVRKRSKTEDHAQVPTVNYPLWPQTFELLLEYGERSGGHALLTSRGEPWLVDRLVGGKRSKVDKIRSNHRRLRDETKLDFPLKLLRKTSATILGRDHPDSIVTMFLGHAPNTIAARHYQAPDQGRFDAAVMGLRGSYFGPRY